MLSSIFVEGMTTASLIICLMAAMAFGTLNACVFLYKSRHSTSFALTLALMPMAVSVVIMMVNGNIGTGVAVAGAFALVRFRSLPGTAREIAAIFVSMALGLALGMGYIGTAAIFFIFSAVFTLTLTALRFGAPSDREKKLKITVPENVDYEELFDGVFQAYGVEARLEKIRTTNMGMLFELTYDAVFPDGKIPKAFMDDLRTRNGNLQITVGTAADKEAL